MRDLTVLEIEASPDWATHYMIVRKDKILFENRFKYCYSSNPNVIYSNIDMISESMPIIRKDLKANKP
jgi:hypothetical protein